MLVLPPTASKCLFDDARVLVDIDGEGGGENGNEGLKISRDTTIKKSGRRRGGGCGGGTMKDGWGKRQEDERALQHERTTGQ
jgi:hypothetical protein